MRIAIALAVASTVVLSLAAPARALSLDVPRLRPPALGRLTAAVTADVDVLDAAAVPSGMFFAAAPLVVPPRYGWVLDDGRALWYAAGASAVVALGTHVLVGLPVSVFTLASTAGLVSVAPAMVLPVLLGAGSVYLLGQAALASAAALFVFNGTSDIYLGNYATALAAHVGGTIAGAGVSALTFGIGGLLVGGLTSLAEFTGSAGLSAVGIFSLLGALPAVVIGGIALVGVPAVIGAVALAATATAKEGYAIDPAWQSPIPVAPATPVARGDAAALPVVAVELPAP